MKKHLIDITAGVESITSATAHFAGIRADLSGILHSLEESQRKHAQKLGRRNETWCMEVMEVARQHPEVVPASIDMDAIERDIAAREVILPLLVSSRQLTKMLEDTFTMLGIDLFNGARGLYKSMKIVADLHGLEAIVASLGEHFAKKSRTAEPAPASPTTTQAATE